MRKGQLGAGSTHALDELILKQSPCCPLLAYVTCAFTVRVQALSGSGMFTEAREYSPQSFRNQEGQTLTLEVIK